MLSYLSESEFQTYIESMPEPDFTDWYAKNKDDFSDQEIYLIGEELKRRESLQDPRDAHDEREWRKALDL